MINNTRHQYMKNDKVPPALRQTANPYSVTLATIALISAILSGCSEKSSINQYKLVWYKDHPAIGSQSSPRTADLNGDGVLDIIMGAGKNEMQKSDMGILAFDGASGELLWKQEAPDQVFGSAAFCDVNGDKVMDIFIGGRSPQLKAIDGKSGALIWDYKHETYANDPVLKYAC